MKTVLRKTVSLALTLGLIFTLSSQISQAGGPGFPPHEGVQQPLPEPTNPPLVKPEPHPQKKVKRPTNVPTPLTTPAKPGNTPPTSPGPESTQPDPESTPADPEPTQSGHTLYTNSKYGFTFKIPLDWHYQEVTIPKPFTFFKCQAVIFYSGHTQLTVYYRDFHDDTTTVVHCPTGEATGVFFRRDDQVRFADYFLAKNALRSDVKDQEITHHIFYDIPTRPGAEIRVNDITFSPFLSNSDGLTPGHIAAGDLILSSFEE